MARQVHSGLVQAGRLLPAALAAARDKAARIGMSVEYVLRTEHGLTAAELGASLAAQHRAEFVAYRDGLRPLPDALKRFGLERCMLHRCVPVAREGGKVVVLMADPSDLPTRDQAEQALGAPVLAKAAFWEDIYRILHDVELQPHPDPGPPPVTYAESAPPSGQGAVSDLGLQILLQAWNANATEIRIHPRETPTVAIKVGDAWRPLPIPEQFAVTLVRRYKVMATLDPTNPSKPLEGLIDLPKGHGGIRAKISTTPLGDGLESALLRLVKA